LVLIDTTGGLMFGILAQRQVQKGQHAECQQQQAMTVANTGRLTETSDSHISHASRIV
jgi:hypothetical protein